MKITSNDFKVLKKWNRKASTKKDIRVGVNVDTIRGIGIVIARKKYEVWVMHEPKDDQIMCCSYVYDVNDVMLSYKHIDKDSKLYKAAWKRIIDSAVNSNQQYEIARNKEIVKEYADYVKGKREMREISTDFGSYTYVRFIGDTFDFEINMIRPFLTDGDKILFALNKGNTITDINGHGWVYKRKIRDQDINYGKCKYVFNTDKQGNKYWD